MKYRGLVISVAVVIMLAILLAGVAVYITSPEQPGHGAVIEINGQTLQVAPGQTYAVRSIQTTTVYTSGTTVTTSAITMTIWAK